ncbi:MAG: 3-methyladenine DNA glycosylase [Micromonosporaceae bacterium]
MTTLALDEWTARRGAYTRRVDAWIEPHLDRRRRGLAHPVLDFLFTYYSFRPAQLRRWQPGGGVVLAGADPAEFGPDFVASADGAWLDESAVLRRRGGQVAWIRRLLVATAGRAAQLGCFGLHEWAMVYRQPPEQLRHSAYPLRLGAASTATVVEANPLRCSHVDAYRFFTAPARPLNWLRPSREAQHEHEQPGCLHATMDLYKWAYKLSPLVPAELIADCFELAGAVRTLDMRASPYDLSALGYEPVRVETAAGRAEYAAGQRHFAERAAPLRTRLIVECDRLLAASNG